jgi:membrane protease YdiL (CAAX protease family)
MKLQHNVSLVPTAAKNCAAPEQCVKQDFTWNCKRKTMTSRITDQTRYNVSPPVILGLLLSLVAPLLWVFVIWPLAKPSMVANEVVMWGLAFGVMALVVFWERRPLSSIGVRGLTWKDGLFALLLGAVLFVLIPILAITVARVTGGPVQSSAVLGELAKQSLFLRILMAFRAGVTEEILFRAYPIERMEGLTGKVWIGAIVSLVIFTILHVPGWGWTHVIVAGIPGLILTCLYIWKRNLIFNIVVHIFPDLIFLLIAPFLPSSPL